MHSHPHTRLHTYKNNIHKNPLTLKYTHKTHQCICICTHTDMHTHNHIHTLSHSCIYALTHSHTHAHKHTPRLHPISALPLIHSPERKVLPESSLGWSVPAEWDYGVCPWFCTCVEVVVSWGCKNAPALTLARNVNILSTSLHILINSRLI